MDKMYLTPTEIFLLKKLLATSLEELARAVITEDKKEKAKILQEVEFFKQLWEKDGGLEVTKETVNLLFEELGRVNERIQRLKNILIER